MSLDLSAALASYVQESRELLEQMEQALLQLEAGGSDAELINAVFRAVHTVKGSGGLFGLDDVVEFAHEAETVLDAVRDGRLPLTADMTGLFLECRDQLGALVDAAVAGDIPAPLRESGRTLRERLRAVNGTRAIPVPMADRAAGEHWHISLRAGRDLLRDGMDPVGVLEYLATLGEIVAIAALDDAIPELAGMDPETCYLGFEIDLKTDLDKAGIEDAFEFIRSSSQVHILPPRSKPSEWAALIHALPEDEDRLGRILVRIGALTRAELAEALGRQAKNGTADRPLGEILVEKGLVPREAVTAAIEKQAKDQKIRNEQFVRIEASKLDRLIDLVGELVISNTVTSLRAEQAGDGTLKEAVKSSGRFVEQVRDAALSLRMVQIGGTFGRFHRVVRDLSRELGKEVQLSISGGETELDKTVVDRIGDPLTHLVRNTLDHGIESAEERLAAGKPAAGTLKLHAYHESGSIVIEVGDDGRGLDRQRIVAKAVDRGLIKSDEGMSEQDVFRLIFRPGFSTAEAVTNISGRGVGMDVVKRTVEDLRGTVEIDSRAGSGTTIRLRLPLTLAIIDGFLVAAGESRFVIPLELVEECVELPEQGLRGYFDLRGSVLPYLRLRDLFETQEAEPERQIAVVVGYAGKRAALVVDRLLGKLQTVIKPLGDVFTPLKWISGCTVLDIGEVGLILDVPALVAKAEKSEANDVGAAALA
jgi:two-component system chemotaxis sensor kinase CheA